MSDPFDIHDILSEFDPLPFPNDLKREAAIIRGEKSMSEENENRNQVLEGLLKLRKPFPDECVNLLPKPYKKDSPPGKCPECGGWHRLPAAHLSYVGHAALTDRLLNVDPTWNWEPMAYDQNGLPRYDENGGLWIWLTVCGIKRPGYGHSVGNTGDAIKERIGDALRNAAMRFGAALEFWHKGKLPPPVEEDSNQNTSTPEEPPKISEEQLANLRALMDETGHGENNPNFRKAFLKVFGIDSEEHLLPNKFNDAIAFLERRRKA